MQNTPLDERRRFTRELAEGLLALADDAQLFADLADAIDRGDVPGYRALLERVPLPREGESCTIVCRTIGFSPVPGTWVWKCRWNKTGAEFAQKPLRPQALQPLAAAKSPEEILSALIRAGLVTCQWEYEPGGWEKKEWCEIVCGPSRPPKPPPPYLLEAHETE